MLSFCTLADSVQTAFHASFSNGALADNRVLQASRGTGVILLVVYALYILFQLNCLRRGEIDHSTLA